MFRPRFRVKENITYRVLDKNGNARKLFKPNKLFDFLVKIGILDVNSYKIPLLFGNWGDHLLVSNLITNAGFAAMASRLTGSGGEAAFTYMALGTGTNAAAVTDTALQSEIVDSGLQRVVATLSRVTTDVTNDTAQLVNSFSITGTKAITEMGILNAASGGTLLNRQVFTAINVQNGDTLQITAKFDFD